MKHNVYRFFSVGAYEKEEAWLNEMAAKGLLLTDVAGFRYTFEEGVPGAYAYRMELLEHWPTHAESVAYLRFLEETGVQLVGSVLRWAYFRRPAADGPFELYSDTASKIRHFKRITAIINMISAAYAFAAVSFLWEAWRQFQAHRSWIARGFENTGYFYAPLTTGCLYVVLILIFQLVIRPVRKSLRKLKVQQRLGE